MLFNQIDFFIFLTVVFTAYWKIRQNRARIILLLSASLIFYMSWNTWHVIIILMITAGDYMSGRLMEVYPRHKRIYLVIAVSLNICVLFVFKYFNFFMSTISVVFGSLPGTESISSGLLLPIGISFYIFQSMSHTIEVYRGTIKPEKSFINYAVFVSFFPQLVAGPIVRAKDFLCQIDKKKIFLTRRFYLGIIFILCGLCKKIIIADYLGAVLVDGVYANPHLHTFIDSLLALYGYAFQIYNDFSGYTDIAIGSAMLFGYRLPVNFNSPYIASSLKDFWKRWHISLSGWIRDYLYVSLGGSRVKKLKIVRNILLTWLICGLWHGASWHFVLWGLMHGAALVAETRIRKKSTDFFEKISSGNMPSRDKPSIPIRIFLRARGSGMLNIARRVIIFHFICLTWIIFRADTPSAAIHIYRNLLTFSTVLRETAVLKGAAMLCIAIALHFITQQTVRNARLRFVRSKLWIKITILVMGTLLCIWFSNLETTPFIYFQF